MKTIYFIDVFVFNGEISKFYRRVGVWDGSLKMGFITQSEELGRWFRIPTTKQCYLSWLKENNPRQYRRLTGRNA